jgi:hypothetical protein
MDVNFAFCDATFLYSQRFVFAIRMTLNEEK